MKFGLTILLLLALVTPGLAQTRPDSSEITETERTVRQKVEANGIHIVHFWAPWCGNSLSELRSGWYDLIEKNSGVDFTFVAIWNDGQTGADMLRQYAIPDRVTVLALPDHGPSADEANRRRSFLGRPLTWTPSTWIFRNGTLAFALNYGETSMTTLQQLIDAAQSDWSHN